MMGPGFDSTSRGHIHALLMWLALCLMALPARGPAQEISHSQTPKIVLDAIEGKLNGAEIERVIVGEKDGHKIYRIEVGKDASGDRQVFRVRKDGTLLQDSEPKDAPAGPSPIAPKPTPVPGASEVRVLPDPASGKAMLSIKKFDGVTRLKTRELEVRVQHDPWRLSVLDKQGRLLLREAEGGSMQYGSQSIARVKRHTSLGRVRIVKRDPPRYHAEDEAVIAGESVRFDCETTEAGRAAAIYVTFASPGVFSLWMTVPGVVAPTRVAFESAADEHFFGLGECWDAQSLDLKGLAVTMANRSGTPDAGGYVPFYLSTRGYGILIDNYLPVAFDYKRGHRVKISL